ncbi:MAG: glycosyltransferase family A protein [Pseudomonadota bacterium]
MTAPLSVLIPANNEAGYIGRCLRSLAEQAPAPPGPKQIIVAANACTDTTIAEAEACRDALQDAGWTMEILDLPTPGKLPALNAAEAQATGQVLVYLDADVTCAPPLMAQLVSALDTDLPRYASGTLQVAAPRSWVTRCFAQVWQQLPFMTTNVQGAGVFAVNRPGRARWGAFPDIIADDAYVRLMFAPDERIKVPAMYQWPMVEGFLRLVRVRRRQDAGVQQLATLYPEIMANESKPPMTLADHGRLFVKNPVAYPVYCAVMIAVKLGRANADAWTRGR